MQHRLKITSLIILLLFCFIGCEMTIEPDPNADKCWTTDQYGQIHFYNCNQGGGGVNNNSPTLKIAVSLPDTAYTNPYAIFFISDTTTMIPDNSKSGICGYDTYFFIECDGVSRVNHYIAILVSQNQTPPITFTPESGDYLGWYKGNGIYPGEKYLYGDPPIISISLKEIP